VGAGVGVGLAVALTVDTTIGASSLELSPPQLKAAPIKIVAASVSAIRTMCPRLKREISSSSR
jgi:hypothetical protein